MTLGTGSDRVLLAHILQCMERIRNYTGGRRKTFNDSHMIQDAVMRNLQTLAETTTHPRKRSIMALCVVRDLGNGME